MGETGFNLLQPQEAPPTFWDKAYAWVVGTARVIIIIVEIIVFGAFVTRFVLDTQSKNLDEKIKIQEVRLDALADKEEYFRKVQEKGTQYEEIWKVSSNYTPILKEINSYLPSITSEISMQIRNETLLIRGFGDFNAVSSMELSLKNSNTFDRTEVFEIQNQGGAASSSGRFAVRAILSNFNSREF